MTVDDIVPLLTGPAAALVICVWVIWWLRGDLKDQRKINRELIKRADAAEVAASTANALLEKLIDHAVSNKNDQRAINGGDP